MDGSTTPSPAGTAADDTTGVVAFLRDRDFPCPLCGYNLRCLTTPRCPECGRELRLTIGLVDPFVRAWITLAAASSASAGLGVFFALMLLRAGWPDRGRLSVANCVIVYFIATIPLALAVLVARRRFMRLRSAVQWRMALAMVIVSVGLMAVLFATLR